MGVLKMTEPITIQKLVNADVDTDTLKEAVNEDKWITARLGKEYASVPMASRLLVENGLLGARPFSTYVKMIAPDIDPPLVEGDYAVVTNDATPTRNGIYQKLNGEWVYSKYNQYIGNQINKQMTALPILSNSNTTYDIDENNLNLAWGIVDKNNKLAVGVDNNGDFMTPSGTIETLGDNSAQYEYAILDTNNNVALGIRKDGKVDMPNNSAYGSLAVADGNIYYVVGTANQQLTTTGSNQSPNFKDAQTVSFVSNRLGRFAEYVVSIDGTGEKLLYADNHKYEQIIITGQSLAQGGSNAAITTTAPYPDNAFNFTNGPVGSQLTQVAPFLKPLAESQYETISTGFAKKLLSPALDRNLLMTGQAYGGAVYDKVRKGGSLGIFERCIEQVKFGQYLNGGSSVRAIFVIHGEGDGNISNPSYDINLKQWLDDFNSTIKDINNQTDDAVMFTCQTSSAAGYKNSSARDDFTTPFAQLKASQDNADIILVGPKYQYTYNDYAHIDAIGTRTLGEYYAKVYRQVAIDGNPWTPFSPKSINSIGNKIIIDFNVPKPPIVIDTTTVLEGTDNQNKGFVLKNATGVTITGVAITKPDQVTITLSADAPIGAVLSYAFHNGTDGKSGREQGARGNLRDSDITQSAYTSAQLHNWCVTFKHTFGA